MRKYEITFSDDSSEIILAYNHHEAHSIAYVLLKDYCGFIEISTIKDITQGEV